MIRKKGFTVVELIGTIIIISIILVILIPNVTKYSNDSRKSIKNSKISTIETAAENYGNDLINTYQSCIDLPSEELEAKCTVSIKELIDEGYMSSEEKTTATIIDPTTNKPLSGKALLCYDPLSISVYASFKNEGEAYSCAAVDLEGGHTLAFQIRQSGYVGGNNLEANVSARGEGFESLSCTSSDTNYIKCSIENRKLILEMTKNKLLSFPETGYKEIEITAIAKFRDSSGKISTIDKVQKVKIYPTDLQIADKDDKCLPINSSDKVDLQATNPGSYTVTSTNESILSGIIRDNQININSGSTPGRATLEAVESNGKNRVSLYRDVYNFSASIPHENERKLAVNSRKSITIIHEGIESVTITSDNPDVLKVSSTSNTEENSITLSDPNETEVYFNAKSTGTANIKITPKGCGKEITTSYTVINMSLKDSELTTYAGNTNKITSEIIVENPINLTCSSSNPNAATCKISEEGTTLEIYPGSEPDDNVTIRVESPDNGFAILTVHVLETSLNISDKDGNRINYICSEVGSGANNLQAFVQGKNTGQGFEIQTDESLINASLQNELVNNRRELYLSGRNSTGRSRVTVKELNGNKSDYVDYYLYSLNLKSDNYDELEKKEIIKVGETSTITIESSNAGEIKNISIDKPDVASITLNEHEPYNFGTDIINLRTISIKGLKIGEATITVESTDCGKKNYNIKVLGHTFAMFIENGEYVNPLENELVMCNTEEDQTSCEVQLPNIGAKENFDETGFTKNKISLNKDDIIYASGANITLNSSNTGQKIYANAYEYDKPECHFVNTKNELKIDDNEQLTLECIDKGSGIKMDYVLTPNDFQVEGNGATIKSIERATAIKNGYSYKINLNYLKPGVTKISLKEKVIEDKLNNQNELSSSNAMIISNNALPLERMWSIGKNKEDSVLAGIYKKDEKSYRMEIYGQGDIKDFMTSDNPSFPEWRGAYKDLITEVAINSDVTSIGNYLFNSHTKLKYFRMPDDIKTIGSYAFLGTSEIENINLSKKLVNIDEHAFEGSGLTSITIPSSVENIGTYAFANIAKYGADNKLEASLETLTFESESKLTALSDNAFQNHALKSLSIPDSIENIGSYAFAQSNPTLKTIAINNTSNLRRINSYAFSGVEITNFHFPDSLESLGDFAISTLKTAKSIHFGKNLKDYGETPVTTDSLTTITVDEENQYLTSYKGILYTKDMKTLLHVPNEYGSTHSNTIDIPEGVETIAIGALNSYFKYDKTAGPTINIPSTLTEVNAGSNFEGYTLSAINVSPANQTYSSSDGVLFNKNKTVAYLLPSCYTNTSYTLPNTVSTLFKKFGYMNYKVKTITIPNSVTVLQSSALESDPNYAFQTINLQSPDILEDDSSMTLIKFPTSTTLGTRTINVKTNALKNKLLENYGKYNDTEEIFKIVVK